MAPPALTVYNKWIYDFYTKANSEFVMEHGGLELLCDCYGINKMTDDEARYFIDALILIHFKLKKRQMIPKKEYEKMIGE